MSLPMTPHDSPKEIRVAARSCRYDSLDVWRGIACLSVVAYHASFLATSPASPSVSNPFALAIYIAQRLWIGVPMFFVISGYCISATAESTRYGNQSVGKYFLRRFRRIYPPFWMFLLGTMAVYGLATLLSKEWLFAGMGGDPRSMSLSSWFGQVTLTESWLPHVLGHERTYAVNHAWTLCYEEQFYFVVGVILLVSPQRYFLAASLITLFSVAARISLGAAATSGFFFDGYWLLFAAGILVYYSTNHCGRSVRVVHMIAFGMLAIACALSHPLFVEHGSAGQLSNEHFFVGSVFAFLLCGLRPLDQKLNSARVLQPFRFCGTLCYSLYLVHWPVTLAVMLFLAGRGIRGDVLTVCVTIPVCIAASVAIAYAFHRIVEIRFLNVSLGASRLASASAKGEVSMRQSLRTGNS